MSYSPCARRCSRCFPGILSFSLDKKTLQMALTSLRTRLRDVSSYLRVPDQWVRAWAPSGCTWKWGCEPERHNRGKANRILFIFLLSTQPCGCASQELPFCALFPDQTVTRYPQTHTHTLTRAHTHTHSIPYSPWKSKGPNWGLFESQIPCLVSSPLPPPWLLGESCQGF